MSLFESFFDNFALFFSCIKSRLSNGTLWEYDDLKVATKVEVTTMGALEVSTTVNFDIYKENKTEKPFTVNIMTNEMLIYIMGFFLVLLGLIVVSLGLCYFFEVDPQSVIT